MKGEEVASVELESGGFPHGDPTGGLVTSAGMSLGVGEGFGHRWRYARVAQSHAAPALPEHCYFAGDALTASRVADAWFAGRAAALNIIQSHSNH
jgi:hypothetical protein